MLTRPRLLVILTYLLLASAAAHAEWPTDWPFLDRDRGWFFYREQRLPVPRPAAPEEEPKPPESPSWLAPVEREAPRKASAEPATIPKEGLALDAWLREVPDTELERLITTATAPAIRAWMPVLMDQALTTLDRGSVRKYLLVHKESLRRSDRFSHIWQELVWTDPTFDRPGSLPMGTLAQSIHEDDRIRREQNNVRALGESVLLLLLVKPDCRQCDAQWDILTTWAATYTLSVRPIATALTTLRDGTIAMPYPEIVKALAVVEYPSIYLVQPSSGYVTRLGAGMLSEQEITTRLLRLLPEAQPEGAIEYATHLPDAPALFTPIPDAAE